MSVEYDAYDGDIKGFLVEVLEAHREVLGLNRLKYQARQDPRNPYRVVLELVPVMSEQDVIQLVERVVGDRISILMKGGQ